MTDDFYIHDAPASDVPPVGPSRKPDWWGMATGILATTTSGALGVLLDFSPRFFALLIASACAAGVVGVARDGLPGSAARKLLGKGFFHGGLTSSLLVIAIIFAVLTVTCHNVRLCVIC